MVVNHGQVNNFVIPDNVRIVNEADVRQHRNDAQIVSIPASVTEIAPETFSGWANLQSIIFQAGSRLESIGDRAFQNSGLRQFRAPPSLQRMGNEVFANCVGLRTVRLNDQLRRMGNDCFRGSALESLNVPSGLELVSGRALVALRPIRVYLSEGLLEIRRELFAESGVGSVSIPASVRKIEDGAFRAAGSLEEVVFSQGSLLDEIGDRAFEGTRISQFDAPVGLTKLGKAAFHNCQRLEHVQLAGNLQALSEGCFEGTALVTLDVPDGVREINDNAFRSCA